MKLFIWKNGYNYFLKYSIAILRLINKYELIEIDIELNLKKLSFIIFVCNLFIAISII